MKDFHAVLLQKEHDLERLRKQVAALRAAIPLLIDDADLREAPPGAIASPVAPDQHLHDLETYYPFVRRRYENG